MPSSYQSPLTLEEVAAHFESWRQNRTSPRSRIPQSLWKEALSLYPEHCASHIIKRPRLNSQRFYTAVRGLQLEVPSPFVEASFISLSKSSLPPSCRVEFERGDGMKMRLEFEGQAPEVNDLWRMFVSFP